MSEDANKYGDESSCSNWLNKKSITIIDDSNELYEYFSDIINSKEGN